MAGAAGGSSDAAGRSPRRACRRLSSSPNSSPTSPGPRRRWPLPLAIVARLLHLVAVGHDDAHVVLGVLQIILCQHRVAGRLSIARSVRYFSAMCAGVPRIFTSGPLDSKLRANGLWFFRLLLFRPRPRRFCCPCLTAQMAPMLLEPVSSMPPRLREHGSPCAGLGRGRDPVSSSFTARASRPRARDDRTTLGAATRTRARA